MEEAQRTRCSASDFDDLSALWYWWLLATKQNNNVSVRLSTYVMAVAIAGSG